MEVSQKLFIFAAKSMLYESEAELKQGKPEESLFEGKRFPIGYGEVSFCWYNSYRIGQSGC